MTQPDTPHDRLRAEIDRRLAVARAATPGPWEVGSGEIRAEAGCRGRVLATIGAYNCLWPNPADIAHIALHDPADAIRRYEGELEVLERHERVEINGVAICHHCNGLCHSTSGLNCDSPDAPWPCPEIRSLAHRLGVSVDG